MTSLTSLFGHLLHQCSSTASGLWGSYEAEGPPGSPCKGSREHGGRSDVQVNNV